jgi:PHP family Zn ribbon phosphoesterase
VEKATVAVEREYRGLVARLGDEFSILNRLSREELFRQAPTRIAEGILRVREGKVNIQAGYDGEYGKITIFSNEPDVAYGEEQLKLF